MLTIDQQISNFILNTYYKNEFKEIQLKQYKGKWLIIFFYPADFTFICPTELEELANLYPKFSREGAEILSVSCDSMYVHKAWHDSSKAVGKITFPMVADPNKKLAEYFGVYLEAEGKSLRASFIIDPDQRLKAFEIHHNDIGRSPQELLRKLQAAKFVRENRGEVCPVNWKPGGKTLKPGIKLVGRI